MGDEVSRESSKRKWFEDLKKSKTAELEALGLDPDQVGHYALPYISHRRKYTGTTRLSSLRPLRELASASHYTISVNVMS